jgi:hypothetical protein
MVIERTGSTEETYSENAVARLTRRENGIAVLRRLPGDGMARGESETAACDRRIGELRQELFDKVGEGDQTILKLRAGLLASMGERDAIIREFQTQWERVRDEQR